MSTDNRTEIDGSLSGLTEELDPHRLTLVWIRGMHEDTCRCVVCLGIDYALTLKSRVRADEREACASLVESVELADPSSLTRKEQLRIYSVLQKASDLIRSRSNAQLKGAACNAVAVEAPVGQSSGISGQLLEAPVGREEK